MSLLSAPLDELLGTRSRVIVLRALARATDGLSGREVARRGKLSPQSTLETLRVLTALGVVDEQRSTGQSLYSLNRETLAYRSLIEPLIEAEQTWTSVLIDSLRAHVAEVAKQGQREILWAGLFGSVARGTDTPDSDIDIAIVARSIEHADALRDANASIAQRTSDSIGRRVSAIVLSLGQLRKLRDAGDPLVMALLADSRQLHGDRTLADLLDD
jgi:predicted nucleotidyltransferase